MPTSDIPIQGFVHEDTDGPYLRCASFVDGEFCEGKQRPQDAEADGSRRWVCPDCGSSTRQRLAAHEQAVADGGSHPAIEALADDAGEAERLEAAVDAAIDCVREGDTIHNAAEWAVDRAGLDAARLPDVRERVTTTLVTGSGGASP